LTARARPSAARTRLFGLIATPNGALRAPPPIAASLLPQKKNKNIDYFQKKMLPFWLELDRGGAYIFPLGYAAPYWATLHLTELRCTLLSSAALSWATLHPFELSYTLLSYAAFNWATYAAPNLS
jgi:hypothetical protein